MLPLERRSISPRQGAYSTNRCAITASPCDAVSTALFSPIIPLEGIEKTSSVRSPLASIEVISPRRRVTISIILLAASSGRFTESSSIGSHFTPSISLIITSGCPTCSSYPSRRIVSISTPRCSTPRPNTIQLSAEGPFSTRKARFLSNSSIKRS